MTLKVRAQAGCEDYKGLTDQPKEPKFKGALCQIFVRSQPYGGPQFGPRLIGGISSSRVPRFLLGLARFTDSLISLL